MLNKTSRDPPTKREDPKQDEGLRAALMAEMKRLPEQQRNVVCAHYEGRATLVEIGLAMEISTSQVEKLYNEAMGRLRSAASDYRKNRN